MKRCNLLAHPSEVSWGSEYVTPPPLMVALFSSILHCPLVVLQARLMTVVLAPHQELANLSLMDTETKV